MCALHVSTVEIHSPNTDSLPPRIDLTNGQLKLGTSGLYVIRPDVAAKVRICLWGAGGGGSSYTRPSRGSAGGYTEGIIKLEKDVSYTILIGQGGREGGYSKAAIGTQTPAYPDGSIAGTYSGYYIGGGGGGSTRFGQGSIINDVNNPNTEYLLIAGGGGGGTDWADYLDSAEKGEGGGLLGGSGGIYYPNGEGPRCPGGGGGQCAGGAGGVGGRNGNGTNGEKYKAGSSTGAGAGGGYFGGGGSSGYYSQGGGGSGYYHWSVKAALTLRGGSGLGSGNPYFESFRTDRPLPTTGCGGSNDHTSVNHGYDGGCIISLISLTQTKVPSSSVSISKSGQIIAHNMSQNVHYTVHYLDANLCGVEVLYCDQKYFTTVPLPLQTFVNLASMTFTISNDLDQITGSSEENDTLVNGIVLVRM
jgi:hypothetical protein